jgi:hypothetical protein
MTSPIEDNLAEGRQPHQGKMPMLMEDDLTDGN